MYYSSFGILALLILLITNYDILKKSNKNTLSSPAILYRQFLFSVMAYYITDILWGILASFKIKTFAYIDTQIYFAVMVLSVFLWGRYVIAYLEEENLFTRILYYTSLTIFVLVLVVLVVNLFIPIVFYFDEEGNYHTSPARYINLTVQLLLFFIMTVYTIYISTKRDRPVKSRYRTIGLFGLAMTIFIALQAMYPFLPFYAMGVMLGTCLLHTFVLEDEKEEKRKLLEDLIQKGNLQEKELGAARHMAYTDSLTGIKNKAAYIEDISIIEQKINEGKLDKVGVVVFDLNSLKKINDTKGHDAGDEYIKAACHIICERFKHSPVYRIGGDEFVAILEGEDYENRRQLLEEFSKMVDEEKKHDGIVIASGSSTLHRNKDKSYMRVFERADRQMYKCKKLLKEQ